MVSWWYVAGAVILTGFGAFAWMVWRILRAMSGR